MKTINECKEQLKELLETQGVELKWQKPITELNSKKVPVTYFSDEVITGKVLFLERQYDVTAGNDPFLADANTVQYLLICPNTSIIHDSIVQDNEGNSWRADSPEQFRHGKERELIYILVPVDRVDAIDVGEATPENPDTGTGEGGEGGEKTDSTDPNTGGQTDGNPDGTEGTDGEKTDGGEIIIYTKKELFEKSREQLFEIYEGHGGTKDEKMTDKEIVAAILGLQKAGTGE